MKRRLNKILLLALLSFLVWPIGLTGSVRAGTAAITSATISPSGSRTNNTRPVASGTLSALSPSVMVYFDDLNTTFGPYDYFVKAHVSSTNFTTENENFGVGGGGAYETGALPYGTYRVFAESITNFDQPPSYYEITANYVIENIKPTLRTAETVDLDNNNKTDAIRIAFSEAILDSSVRASDFSLAGFNTVLFDPALDDANNDTVYFRLNEATDSKPAPKVTYTKGTLSDLAGNLVESDNGGIIANDKVGPAIDITFKSDSPIDSDTTTVAGITESGSLITITGGQDESRVQLTLSQDVFSLSMNLKQDELNYLKVNAADSTGNQSRAIEISIREDSSPPLLKVIAPGNNSTLSGSFTVSYEASDPSGTLTQLLVNDIIQAGFTSGQSLDLANGTYKIRVRSCDSLSHCTIDERLITVDRANGNPTAYTTSQNRGTPTVSVSSSPILTTATAPQIETPSPAVDIANAGDESEISVKASGDSAGRVLGTEKRSGIPSYLWAAAIASLILFTFVWSKFFLRHHKKDH
ncbi:MAG: hypothetical protein AAB360_01345 [Patescibacteria group bacterium]